MTKNSTCYINVKAQEIPFLSSNKWKSSVDWVDTDILKHYYDACWPDVLQSASGARQLLKHIDPKLGEPMEEKDYGGNCRLYDHERPDDPFHNIKVRKRQLFIKT